MPSNRNRAAWNPSMSKNNTVTFRLEPAPHSKLSGRAEELDISKHELAREIVMTVLASDGHNTKLRSGPSGSAGGEAIPVDSVGEDVQLQLKELRADILELRNDLAFVLESAFVIWGISPTEAKRLVAEKLSQK